MNTTTASPARANGLALSALLAPADVRGLAALCHIGAYAYGVAVMALSVVADTMGLEGFWSESSVYTTSAMWIAFAGFVYGPALAALWAARRSPWGGFLRSHAARALLFHGLAGLLVLTGRSAGEEPRIPDWLGVPLSVAFVGFAILWCILPLGAAFRAKDGDLAWYPLATRIFPDPPAP